jgi:hypothetical protein
MKQGLKIEYDWKLIGAELANLSDVEQIDFFKGFITECKTWGTHYQIEMQLAFINEKLTKEEKDLLGMLSYENND